MNDIKSWRDLGFSSFMTRTIPSSNRLSSIGARNLIPIGGISPSRLVSPLNATTDIVFSSTDNNTAAWASGTIYFADGTNSGTMDAGNTGNISATTYVYYDKEVLGVLQSTTTVANATKFNRLLIAIVETGASGKDCKITPTIAAGLNVSGITAAQITADTITATEIEAGTITATELAADSVTADKIDVSQLDAITVNTGTLNVDESITAGGSADGIIYVKDSSNNTKVQLDQDGITINSGKMTIKDSGETTIIDSAGLVSTASFISGSVHNTSTRSITSTSFVDVANTSVTTASFSRTTNVLIFMNVIMKLYLPDTDEIQWGQVVLNIDGTDKTLTSFDYTLTDCRLYTPGEFSFDSRTLSHTGLSIESLASGTHTFKIRSKVGGQTLKILSTSVVYLVLGK